MTSRNLMSMSLAGLLLVSALPASGAEPAGPRTRVVDPARAKTQEADRQRLLAKLRDEAPKVDDTPAPRNTLDLPIFRRHDKP